MNIFLKILPIILITIIFYILIYDLYPKYQQTLALAQELNGLKSKENNINALEKLITTLNQNTTIQQLISNQKVLDLWLPQQPNIEEILASLSGIYQANGLVFKGAEINIIEEPKQFNPNILPVKVVNLNLSVNLASDKLLSFIEGIEKNVRLMNIKQANLTPELFQFKVESYFLSTQ